VDGKAPRPRERVVEARLLKGDEQYDAAHYEKLVLRAIESCVLPFGWTAPRLAQLLAGREQASLAAWARGESRPMATWNASSPRSRT
jgi:hypothetical protein